MSAGSQDAAERPALRAILWAVAAGLALRLAIALLRPEYVSGDAMWYVRIAREIAEEGPFGPNTEKFQRPPLYAMVVAAFLRLFGEDFAPWLRAAQAAAGAATVWWTARIALRLVPSRPAVAIATAWVVALDPWAADFAKILYTETFVNAATALFAWTCVRALPAPRVRDILVAGTAGAAMTLLRLDAIAVVVAGCVAAAITATVRTGGAVRQCLRWGAVAGLAAALCVPWSAHATARTGRTVVVGNASTMTGVVEQQGFVLWTTTWVLPRRQALGVLWWTATLVEQDWIPSSVFATPEEERVVRHGIDLCRAERRFVPEAEAGFERVARERIRREPFRYYVVNPLHRSALIWLDPFDSDRPDVIRHQRRSAFGAAFEAATFVWVLIGAVGFLTAWVLVWRPSGPGFLPSVLILGRTYSLLVAGLAAGGQHLCERRYMTCVEPFAQFLAVWAVTAAADRIRRRRADPAGTPALPQDRG